MSHYCTDIVIKYFNEKRKKNRLKKNRERESNRKKKGITAVIQLTCQDLYIDPRGKEIGKLVPTKTVT